MGCALRESTEVIDLMYKGVVKASTIELRAAGSNGREPYRAYPTQYPSDAYTARFLLSHPIPSHPIPSRPIHYLRA